MDTISIDDFAKMDLRVGTITAAESIPKSKLLKLSVSFGDEIGTKTVLAGIAKDFLPETLPGTPVLAVLNLPPREMKGFVSEAMLLATQTADGKLVLASCPGAPDGAKLG
jgi:methionine--tRNA ligase beta chain